MTGQMKNKQKLTELVIKAQAGDQNALNDLIGACYEDLYFFAYQTVKDPDTASDIIQDSCISIITNLSKLQSPEAFSVWVRNITYNHCAMHFRKTKEVQPLETEDGESILDSLPDESEGSLPEQVVEDKEFQKTMQDMLDSLPGEQRSAMMLYYYEKLSVKQIAEVFETSEGTIKSRLNYGRKAMKGKVEEYEKKNGVRLHSSLLPLFLLWMFRGTKESLPKATMPVLLGASSAAATGAAGAAAATSAAATGAAGAVAASTGLVAKIVAGVVAAVITAGAVIGGVAILGKDKAPSSDHNGHQHDYVSQAYDENNHWGMCECGEASEAASHHFNGRYCDVCNYAKPSEGLAFAKVADGYAVVGIGDCTDTDISIPSTHEGKPVVAIKPAYIEGEWDDDEYDIFHGDTDGPFEENDTITRVFIPGSVKYIGPDAFAGCDSLSEVTISEGVEQLDSWAFADCTALKEMVIPSTVKRVDDPFVRSGLTKVIISHGVTDISNTFSECASLETVILPDTVTKMEGAFYDCTSLNNVTIPDGVTSLKDAFQYCSSLTQISIPEGVTNIENAFRECISLTEVIIPDSVTHMDFSFYGCTALKRSNFPANMQSASSAFYNCTSLEYLTIPVFTSETYTYYSTGTPHALKEVHYAGTHNQYLSDEMIGFRQFIRSGPVIYCSNGYYDENHNFFHQDNVYDRYEATSVTHWGIYDCNCRTEQVSHTFENGICTECKMPKPSTGLNAPTDGQNCHVLGIGTCVDSNIALYFQTTSIGQTNSLVIEKSAFENNQSIKSVQIIGNALYWKNYEDRPKDQWTNPIGIYPMAFAGCTSLETVTFSDFVHIYGTHIFSNCTSLKEITLPYSYGYQASGIPAYTFNECSSLTSVTIPQNYHYIDEGAFFNCTSLTDIYYQDSMAAWEATTKAETEYDPITGEITQYAWDYGTGDYVVHCTDGDIYKNAT